MSSFLGPALTVACIISDSNVAAIPLSSSSFDASTPMDRSLSQPAVIAPDTHLLTFPKTDPESSSKPQTLPPTVYGPLASHPKFDRSELEAERDRRKHAAASPSSDHASESSELDIPLPVSPPDSSGRNKPDAERAPPTAASPEVTSDKNKPHLDFTRKHKLSANPPAESSVDAGNNNTPTTDDPNISAGLWHPPLVQTHKEAASSDPVPNPPVVDSGKPGLSAASYTGESGTIEIEADPSLFEGDPSGDPVEDDADYQPVPFDEALNEGSGLEEPSTDVGVGNVKEVPTGTSGTMVLPLYDSPVHDGAPILLNEEPDGCYDDGMNCSYMPGCPNRCSPA